MPIARTLSGYIARQFLTWFGGRLRHDDQRHLPARLYRADAALRLAGPGHLGRAAGDGGAQAAAYRAGCDAVRDPVRDDAGVLAPDPQQRTGRGPRRRRFGVGVSRARPPDGAADRDRRRHAVQPDRIGDAGQLREAGQPHPATGRRSDQPVECARCGCARAMAPAARSSSTARSSPAATWRCAMSACSSWTAARSSPRGSRRDRPGSSAGSGWSSRASASAPESRPNRLLQCGCHRA